MAEYQQEQTETGLSMLLEVIDALKGTVLTLWWLAGGHGISFCRSMDPIRLDNMLDRSTAYVGRSVLEREALRRLTERPILVVTGIGGVGKSEFACSLAHQLSHNHESTSGAAGRGVAGCRKRGWTRTTFGCSISGRVGLFPKACRDPVNALN